MRVVGILGIVLDHLEAHRQVVEGAAEVGFPSGLVGGELVDLPAGDGPGLKRHTNHRDDFQVPFCSKLTLC